MNKAERDARQVELKSIYRAYARDPAFDRLRQHAPPKRVVPGRGSMSPRFIFVGEAPGEMEALRRKPFDGPAGQVLDDLLTHVGLSRRDIFLTNVVKYRPTIGALRVRNRTPDTREIDASRPYLLREIEVFGPGVPVITLGATPLRAFNYDDGWRDQPRPRITDWHGRGWYDAYRMYMALYHPAVAVYEPSMIDVLKSDIIKISFML